MLTDYTKLEAWKHAMDLAVRVHTLSEGFPKEERFSLTDQLRRAALSIAANVAEGFGRYSYPDKMHKYVQARGELIEVMTFLQYSERVRYISTTQAQDLLVDCEEIHKLLNGLISKMDELAHSSTS